MAGIAHVRGRHPLATGLFAGAALGVGLGLLFAPRRGREMRKQMGNGVNYVVNSTSSGYRRAKGAVGNIAKSSHGIYATTRDNVVKGAKGTSQYVRDVAEVVTMKTRRVSDGTLRRVPANSPASPTSGQPRKAV